MALPRQSKGCPPAAAMEQASAQQPGPPITTVWPKLAQYLSVVDALAAAQASKAWHHAVTDASPWAPRRIDGAKAAVAACEAAAAAARATANVPHKYRRSRLMDLEDRPAYRNFVSGEVGALSLARILGACSLHGKFVDLGSGTGRPLVYAATARRVRGINRNRAPGRLRAVLARDAGARRVQMARPSAGLRF